MATLLREYGIEIRVPVVAIDDLCAEFNIDWCALLAEQEERFESSIAAADWVAALVAGLLPREVVGYLGYDVDACGL